MIIFETNFNVVTKLFDDFEKNAILQRDANFKYLNHFLYEMRFTNDFNNRKRSSRKYFIVYRHKVYKRIMQVV